jgi:hypothetical protein
VEAEASRALSWGIGSFATFTAMRRASSNVRNDASNTLKPYHALDAELLFH